VIPQNESKEIISNNNLIFLESMKYYVIKELYTDMMPKKNALQAMEEISILGSLSSPFIVEYIDSFVSATKVNIIMEYCENGDLQTYLLNKLKERCSVFNRSYNLEDLYTNLLRCALLAQSRDST